MELRTSVRKNSRKLHDGAWKGELRTKRSDATAHIRTRVKEGGLCGGKSLQFATLMHVSGHLGTGQKDAFNPKP